jgi:hypothetical protein
MIQKHYENFLTTLYRFIHDLDRYHQTDGTKQTLEIYNKLDMAKVIFRIYTMLHKNNALLSNKDEILFQNEFKILPNVNVSEIWSTLVTGRKQKVWTYLSILQIESDIIVNSSSKHKTQKVQPEIVPVIQTDENQEEEKEEKEEEETADKKDPEPFVFNPYVGIGNAIGPDENDYGVEEMYASLANMPDEDTSVGPGLESLANIIGLDKMIDFDGLSEQLRNMKSEDIDNATNNIKEMLGSGVDENTANMIGSMLTDISDEMKTKDLGKGSGFKNIMSIAETVAGKMKPKIQNGELDINKLVNSTKAFANNCVDENGNPLFDADSGPMAMLTQLMGQMTGQGNEDGNVDPSQMMNMLQGMDMGNIGGMDMSALLNQGAPPGPSSNRGQKKRRKKKKGKRKK